MLEQMDASIKGRQKLKRVFVRNGIITRYLSM